MRNLKKSLLFLVVVSACGVEKKQESKEHDLMKDYDRREGMFLVDKQAFKGDIRGKRIFDLCVKTNKTEMESGFLKYLGEAVNEQEGRGEEYVMSCSKLATEVPNLKKFFSMAVNGENSKFDYSYFKDFSSLESLTIISGDMGDFSQISELTQLKSLSVKHSIYHDTAKLGKLKNLEEISIDSIDMNQITNYAFLKDLPNIRVITLSNENDFNLDSFRAIKNIRLELILPKNDKIFVELKQLSSLKKLEIVGIDDSKLKAIAELNQLEELSIIDAQQSCNVSLLANLTNLKVLEVNNDLTKPENCPTESESPGVNKFCSELKKSKNN